MSLSTIKDVSRRLHRFGRTLCGQDFVAEPEIACRRVRLGSEYGGWFVRPDWLTLESVVMSVGVALSGRSSGHAGTAHRGSAS
jgi:hypothetical protein